MPQTRSRSRRARKQVDQQTNVETSQNAQPPKAPLKQTVKAKLAQERQLLDEAKAQFEKDKLANEQSKLEFEQQKQAQEQVKQTLQAKEQALALQKQAQMQKQVEIEKQKQEQEKIARQLKEDTMKTQQDNSKIQSDLDAQKKEQEVALKQLQQQDKNLKEAQTQLEAEKREFAHQVEVAKHQEQALKAQMQSQQQTLKPKLPLPSAQVPQKPKTFGELRARVAQPPAQTEEQTRKQQFLFLRICLHRAFTEKLGKAWVIPPQGEVQNPNNTKFAIHKPGNPNQGVEIILEEALATFKLLSTDAESMDGLNKSMDAWFDAYKAWCERNGSNANIEFDLTVFDQNQIKPIVSVLDKLKQPLTKVTLVDPQTQARRELTLEEINLFRDKEKKVEKEEAADTTEKSQAQNQRRNENRI
ncbi:MAG: hypothetical protein JSS07_00375 [Proteobacteria bacterium]|nr:hypothetical protein [Pseudomonadota bacterium]